MEVVELHVKSPGGGEDIVEIPADLWERFEAKAKELNLSIQETFELAVSEYLKGRGY